MPISPSDFESAISRIGDDPDALHEYGRWLRSIEGSLVEHLSSYHSGSNVPTDSAIHNDKDALLAPAWNALYETREYGKLVHSFSMAQHRKKMRILSNSPPNGLLSLPLEILTEIVALLTAEKNKYSAQQTRMTIKQLSLVSRAFRNLVVHTPTLWSKLDAPYCQNDGFDTRIARSRSVPLTFEMKLASSMDHMRILDAVVPLTTRCRSIYARIDTLVEGVLEVHPCLSFPRVEDAMLSFDEGDDFDRIFRGWEFPAIKRLTLVNAVPNQGLFTALTSFTLKITEDFTPLFLRRILPFLKHLHSLQELWIKFSSHTDFTVDADFSPVQLHSLASLSLSNCDSWWGSRESAICFGHIFAAIRVPDVCDVRVQIGHLDEGSIDNWIQSFASATDELRKVNYLSFYAERPLSSVSVARFLALFPNTRKLHLRFPKIVSTMGGIREHECPNLDQLRSLAVSSPNRPPFESWLLEGFRDRFTNYPARVEVSSNSMARGLPCADELTVLYGPGG